jgi:antitoxin component HigA of HigAB toxin-antitoxin module
MEAIGKNKITDYIRQYPEFAAAIVFAFKDFPYRIKTHSTAGIGSCDTQLGASGYWLRYSTNLWFQTASVVCFGTQEDLRSHADAELERFKAENPGVVLVTKEVTFTTPARKPSGKHTAVIAPPPVTETKLSITGIDLELLPGGQLNTISEYEAAFDRANTIFKSKPRTPEFDELATLLPRIKYYEHTHIALPKLTPLDVIKLKMEERDMSPQHLARVLRTDEEKVEQLLNGNKPLSDQRLAKLFKYFRVRYLINNPEFFA